MNEQEIVKEISRIFDEMMKQIYRGFAGSQNAKKKARVASVELAKLLKEYRKETVR